MYYEPKRNTSVELSVLKLSSIHRESTKRDSEAIDSPRHSKNSKNSNNSLWTQCMDFFNIFETVAPDFRRVFINSPSNNAEFPNNKVTNTKYNLFTFIPKNLWLQFKRFMNLYFLIIAIIQLNPIIAPVSPLTIWIPLIVIFTISAAKEAADDYVRWKADKRANERPYTVLLNGKKKVKQSQKILVGDLIWVKEDEEIPADIVILTTSEENGECFIHTANLDGEADLKSRNAVSTTAGMSEEELSNLVALVECAPPSQDINSFDARLIVDDPTEQWISIDEKNLALQATRLKNTKWICGLFIQGMIQNLAKIKDHLPLSLPNWIVE